MTHRKNETGGDLETDIADLRLKIATILPEIVAAGLDPVKELGIRRHQVPLASPRGGCSPKRRAGIERRNALLLQLVDVIDPDGERSVQYLSDVIGLAWRAFKSPRDAEGGRMIHPPFPLSSVAHILGDLDALDLANVMVSERTFREIIRSKRGNSIRQN